MNLGNSAPILSLVAAAAATCIAASPVFAATCSAASPATRVALVELYTSEGCSSCPPADKWLSNLGHAPPDKVAALSMHVKYWDYIGWKDPFAKAEFTDRQQWLGSLNGNRTIYTPGVFVGGREDASWRRDSAEEIARINKTPAAAKIVIDIEKGQQGGRGKVTASIDAANANSRLSSAVLFVALTENGVNSNVTAGENSGEHLSHDHVVRSWSGPQAFDAQGHATTTIEATGTGDLGVTAFVQDKSTGEVLQALSSKVCEPSL